MELACKKQWYKDKNDGCKLKGIFLSISISYACNYLWVFELLFFFLLIIKLGIQNVGFQKVILILGESKPPFCHWQMYFYNYFPSYSALFSTG